VYHALIAPHHPFIRHDLCFEPGAIMEHAQGIGVGQAAVGRRLAYRTGYAQYYQFAAERPGYFLPGAALILLVGFVLRMWNLGSASLWTDEVLTAVRASVSLRDSFNSILSTGNQTPIYFISLQLLPSFDETLLRLPSALMGLFGIALLMFVAVRLYGRYELALWAGALLAVNPYHVWLSRTARPYAMIFVLSLFISYSFLMMARGKQSRMRWILFTAASLMAYLTHYSAAALLAAQFVSFVFLMRDRRQFFIRWMIAQACAAVPVLIWLYVLSRHPIAVGPAWVPTPDLRDIPLTIWAMTLGYTGALKWYMVPALMIVSASLVFGMFYAVREGRRSPDNFYWFWLIVAPLVPVFLISAFIVSFYVDRYFMIFLPALVLLIPLIWTRLPRQLWQIALAVVIVTNTHNVLLAFSDGSYVRADWRGAADYVESNFRPGDQIMIERTNVQQAFMRYFEPPEAGIDSHLILMSDKPDLEAVEQNSRRIWVVYRNPIEDVHRQGVMPDFNPFRPGQSSMGDWLAEHRDQVVAHGKYNGVRVLLLDLRLPVMASEVPAR